MSRKFDASPSSIYSIFTLYMYISGKQVKRWYQKCQHYSNDLLWKQRNFVTNVDRVHRGAIYQFLVWWFYYFHSYKSIGKKTGKTHLCAMMTKGSCLFKVYECAPVDNCTTRYAQLTGRNLRLPKMRYCTSFSIQFSVCTLIATHVSQFQNCNVYLKKRSFE